MVNSKSLFSPTLWAFRIAFGGSAAFILALIFEGALPGGLERGINLDSQPELNRDPSALILLVPSCVIVIHHLVVIRAIYLRDNHSTETWQRIGAIVDWICLSMEALACIVVAFIVVELIRDWPVLFFLGLASLTQTIGMIGFWLFRTIGICVSKGKTLFAPFEDDRHTANSWLLGGGLRGLHGEHRWIICLRVLLAAVFPYALFTYGVYAIIVLPMQEATQIPVITYRTTDISQFDTSALNWTIFTLLSPQTSAKISSAAVMAMTLGNLSVPCAPGIPLNDRKIVVSCNRSLSETARLPDLLITVNFAAMNVTSNFSSSISDSTVYIFVGQTSVSDDVLSTTSPIPLDPDQHLYGHVISEGRQRFIKPVVSSLGVFSRSRYFFSSKVLTLASDPSPVIDRVNNTATLRLTSVSPKLIDWTVVHQERREKSVLNGFSASGGLWTALNGTFALLFGGSLTCALFGARPLSVFGLVHWFQKPHLHDKNKFPKVADPMKASDQLNAFLDTHVIHFDPNFHSNGHDGANQEILGS